MRTHSHTQNGNSPAAKQFDVIAVTPASEKLFAQCCEKLDVDVIALDLAHRLPYFIKSKQANIAIERGKRSAAVLWCSPARIFVQLDFASRSRTQLDVWQKC